MRTRSLPSPAPSRPARPLLPLLLALLLPLLPAAAAARARPPFSPAGVPFHNADPETMGNAAGTMLYAPLFPKQSSAAVPSTAASGPPPLQPQPRQQRRTARSSDGAASSSSSFSSFAEMRASIAPLVWTEATWLRSAGPGVRWLHSLVPYSSPDKRAVKSGLLLVGGLTLPDAAAGASVFEHAVESAADVWAYTIRVRAVVAPMSCPRQHPSQPALVPTPTSHSPPPPHPQDGTWRRLVGREDMPERLHRGGSAVAMRYDANGYNAVLHLTGGASFVNGLAMLPDMYNDDWVLNVDATIVKAVAEGLDETLVEAPYFQDILSHMNGTNQTTGWLQQAGAANSTDLRPPHRFGQSDALLGDRFQALFGGVTMDYCLTLPADEPVCRVAEATAADGGVPSQMYLNDLWIKDLAVTPARWYKVPRPANAEWPHPRCLASLTAVGEQLLLFGGSNTTFNANNLNETQINFDDGHVWTLDVSSLLKLGFRGGDVDEALSQLSWSKVGQRESRHGVLPSQVRELQSLGFSLRCTALLR